MRVLKQLRFTIALGLSALTFGASADDTLKQRVEEMLPSAEEDRFFEIDWRMDLVKARQEANEVGKPMFMWMMNGHPFGAT